MKKIIIGSLLVIGVALAFAGKWYLNRNNYEPLPFWQASNEQSTIQVDHSQWQEVLDEYLISDDPSGVNFVDYTSLAEEPDLLNDYVTKMQALDPRELNRSQQFAYWVNLYNALTMKVIVENYPVSSILKISSSAVPSGPWDDLVAIIQGQSITLNDIEHRILRSYWSDHRIHFAVNCASFGCPNVQIDAFTAENTEDLLNSAAIEFLNHPRGLTAKGDDLVLSSIFKWYASDFGDSEEEIVKTLTQYVDDPALKSKLAQVGSIEYDYDWSLNDFK